jgi:hypothetical protein
VRATRIDANRDVSDLVALRCILDDLPAQRLTDIPCTASAFRAKQKRNDWLSFDETSYFGCQDGSGASELKRFVRRRSEEQPDASSVAE